MHRISHKYPVPSPLAYSHYTYMNAKLNAIPSEYLMPLYGQVKVKVWCVYFGEWVYSVWHVNIFFCVHMPMKRTQKSNKLFIKWGLGWTIAIEWNRSKLISIFSIYIFNRKAVWEKKSLALKYSSLKVNSWKLKGINLFIRIWIRLHLFSRFTLKNTNNLGID